MIADHSLKGYAWKGIKESKGMQWLEVVVIYSLEGRY